MDKAGWIIGAVLIGVLAGWTLALQTTDKLNDRAHATLISVLEERTVLRNQNAILATKHKAVLTDLVQYRGTPQIAAILTKHGVTIQEKPVASPVPEEVPEKKSKRNRKRK